MVRVRRTLDLHTPMRAVILFLLCSFPERLKEVSMPAGAVVLSWLQREHSRS